MQLVLGLRAKYGTDSAIARKAGIDKSRISRWARGDIAGGITLTNLVRLADVADHSLGDMLMLLYDVKPEQLMPTVDPATVDAVVAGPDGPRERVARLPGSRYRMLLLLREDEEADAED